MRKRGVKEEARNGGERARRVEERSGGTRKKRSKREVKRKREMR